MVIKVKEKFEKTRHFKNNDKSKKYFVRGQRNTRYHDRILFNQKNLYISDFVLNVKSTPASTFHNYFTIIRSRKCGINYARFRTFIW